MGEFVVRFSWTPAQYYAMTWAEREAIINASNKADKA